MDKDTTFEQQLDTKIHEKVLNCEVQDESGLNDFQKIPDQQGIAIPKVGITRFRIPLSFKHRDGSVMNHDCETSMFVNLAKNKTGINMSRLCRILQDEGAGNYIGPKFFKKLLERYRTDLRDNDTEEKLQDAYIKIKMSYPVKQLSLKSSNWGWQYYKTVLEARETQGVGLKFFLTLEYEYSSTCPCSLSMAKQYEADYAAGLTNEGNGIGVAHAQRSLATAKIEIDPNSNFVIEDLIELMRLSIPTETQSLVKRVDEQAFAILNGANPMFVEHASKRIFKVFNAQPQILDWLVTLEHFESLHSHNAVAVINKGIKNGLTHDHLF